GWRRTRRARGTASAYGRCSWAPRTSTATRWWRRPAPPWTGSPTTPPSPFTRVGRRLPAHSTSLGKALLATHSDEQVRKMLPETLASLTEHTITDREQLIEELRQVREQGIAVDREENTLGLRCFGVAIPYRTPARDAISCSV